MSRVKEIKNIYSDLLLLPVVLLLVRHGVLADVVLVEAVLVHARLPAVPLAEVLADCVW